MSKVEVIRVYEDEGRRTKQYRVLADRLWPRGVRKEALDVDEWAKDVAPSTELRKWYGHQPEHFQEFAKRYRAELKKEPASQALAQLRAELKRGDLILLTATRDTEHSGAEVLRQLLSEH